MYNDTTIIKRTKGINWDTAIFMTLFHLGAVAALLMFSWQWLVNSATHMWGRRRFATHDDSTNNWWVALVTFGEGWHNNHHAHQTSARHGLAWYEVDLNWWGIRAMQFLGLAKSIKLASAATR